jgi:signal transduction histidine kinase
MRDPEHSDSSGRAAALGLVQRRGRASNGDRGNGDPGTTSSLRARRTLTAAGVALVLGLVATHVVVVAAVHPPLRELDRIGQDHARAVSVGIRLHRQLSDLRRRVVSVVRSPAAAEVDTSGDFRALAATASELVPLADTDVEQRGLAELTNELHACALMVGHLEGALRAGDVGTARSDLLSFLEHSAQANQASDSIVQYNLDEVRRSTARVHRGMTWALAATSVLSILVVTAALLLIRTSRSAMSAYAELLERHATEMGAFASRAAHELRSPLQTLTLSLAAVGVAPSPRALDRANSGVRRLRETIDELLEFSRSGAEPAPDVRADVAGAVADVLQDVEGSAAEAHVTLSAEVPRGLLVRMAPGHLRTVVSNLVINAVKYGAEVPGARVDVFARPAGDAVDILVHDTGPGIAPDAVPRVFEPFFRATSRPGGYGLGLATVKRLVDAHGGCVDIESAPGRGTTVAIHLPVAASSASAIGSAHP